MNWNFINNESCTLFICYTSYNVINGHGASHEFLHLSKQPYLEKCASRHAISNPITFWKDKVIFSYLTLAECCRKNLLAPHDTLYDPLYDPVYILNLVFGSTWMWVWKPIWFHWPANDQNHIWNCDKISFFDYSSWPELINFWFSGSFDLWFKYSWHLQRIDDEWFASEGPGESHSECGELMAFNHLTLKVCIFCSFPTCCIELLTRQCLESSRDHIDCFLLASLLYVNVKLYHL